MASQHYWSTGEGNELTTAGNSQFNSLAHTAYMTASGIPNTAYMLANFRLSAFYQVAPAAGALVALHITYALNGTAFPDGNNATAPAAGPLVGMFPIRAITGAQVVDVMGVNIYPYTFMPILYNSAGQAFTATGNVLVFNRFTDQAV